MFYQTRQQRQQPLQNKPTHKRLSHQSSPTKTPNKERYMTNKRTKQAASKQDLKNDRNEEKQNRMGKE